MRFTILLALLPLITARDFIPLRRQDTSPSPSFDTEFPSTTAVPGIPDCAEECYSKARDQTTDCPDESIACLCAQPEVQGFIASCLQASCSTNDLESAAQYGIALCRAAVASETASTSAAPSASATPASSAAVAVSSAASQGGDQAAIESSSQGESSASAAAPQASEASDVPVSVAATSVSAAAADTPPTTIVVVTSTASSRASNAAAVSSTSRSSTSTRASAASAISSGYAVPTARAGMVGVLLAAGGVVLAL